MPTGLPPIWIITNPEHPAGPVAPVVAALTDCPPGVVGVQLRAKRASDRDLVRWGRELRAVTRDHGSPLTVNRRVDVAEIVGADGVHLPERGLSPLEVRAEWPELALIGASRHDRAGLSQVAAAGASFAFLSPVFPVPGKAEPMGIEGFATTIADVGVPTYALGGIQPAHIAPLIASGAAGVAVRRAIYDAADPRAALRALLAELDKTGMNGE